MGKNITEAVRKVCLSFPESEEQPSRGSPDFRVRDKTFATYAVNHHGDGRIALWLNAPDGAQRFYSENEPEHYFVPPYVGPRGWLGVELDQGLGWRTVAKRVREAYEKTAPAALVRILGPTIEIEPPTETLDPEEFDPLLEPRAQAKLERLRALCLELPETSESTQFGTPAFKAGKKTFCGAHRYGRRMHLEFWVGRDRQAMLTFDKRYSIPGYTGHNGWIHLDVEDQVYWDEVRALALESYRHFALQRMLKALPAEA